MGIPESQLDTWSHQGSVTQSKNTYATIKLALEDGGTDYASKDYSVFLQGSYGNDTNIYAESDVDVVIRLDSVYYYDISALSEAEQAEFHRNSSSGSYSYDTFKAGVVKALEKRFGASKISAGNKAIKITADGSRRNADVLACADFRRYTSWSASGGTYERGICFWNGAGKRIANYPRLHSSNCTTKHQNTSSWYKPMVRILKNMRSKLVEDGVLEAGVAPSYYVEGLLYNVPTEKFGSSYASTFTAAVNWIHQADRTKFVCANEQYYLLRDGHETCWPVADGDGFLNAVIEMWNEW
jgi:hypothetical protein